MQQNTMTTTERWTCSSKAWYHFWYYCNMISFLNRWCTVRIIK